MSTFAMTRLGLRFYEKPPVGAAGAATAKRKSDAVPQSALEQITAFIPSDALGIYIAGNSIIDPHSGAGKWAIFGVVGCLIPLFVWLTRISVGKQADVAGLDTWLGRRRGFWLSLFGIVAYAAWVAAMPSSPFATIHEKAAQVGAWVAVILSCLLPLLAKRFGVTG